VSVKFIVKEWVQIVVKETQQGKHQRPQNSVPEPHKKEQGARIEQPIQTDVAIITNKK
jgi:hypothetical protein